MKKTVLMLLSAGIWVYAGAQNSASSKFTPSKPIPSRQLRQHAANKNDAPAFYVQAANDKDNERKKSGLRPQATGGVPCGSAYNLYGVLNSELTNVTVDSTLGMILFTHREDNSKFSTGGSGAYEASISTTEGTSWDTSTIMFKSITTRYPNGVIYNPAGNTNLSNAYWVTCGPVTTSNTSDQWSSWDSVAFGSVSLAGTNLSQQYKANGKPGVDIQEGMQFMSVGNDGAVHSIGDGYRYSTTSDRYLGSPVNTGTFNSGTFNWSQTKIYPHFMPADHSSTTYDTIPELMTVSGMAWSQDGTVGYAVFFGNLDSTDAVSGQNLNFASSQPIVYKTTNSGASWNMMTPHNWRNDSVLVNYLHPTADSPSVVLPIWGLFHNAGAQGGEDDFDLVVDANKNLHIISGITAASIATPDSSEYYGFFNPRRDFLFDMYTTSATGGWRARYIDTLVAEATQLVNIPNVWASTTSGPLSMGHRIQTSRTTDGSKIFVTWLDDYIDYTGFSTPDSMQFPDMFGQGYDVNTKVATPIKQFSNTADRFYICVSDKPLVSGAVGSRTYTIPVVRVEEPTSANDGTLPVYFLYDASDTYTDNDFIPQGISPIKSSAFSITPNYPNPYTGLTKFGVTLTKESIVNVDVYNMVGQNMLTMSPEKLSPGTHTITINGNGFAPGVYFYRVTVDGTSLTQKMVIE